MSLPHVASDLVWVSARQLSLRSQPGQDQGHAADLGCDPAGQPHRDDRAYAHTSHQRGGDLKD
jgi:hypothetical protein